MSKNVMKYFAQEDIPVSPVYVDGERVSMLSEYDMIGGMRSSERKKAKRKEGEE